MGTWGEGLYDNDSALDELGDLVSIDEEERDIVVLTTRIGLLVWFKPVGVTHDDGELKRLVDERAEDLARLPAETRAALEALVADPESATKEGSRKPEATAVLGGYSDGPQIDALLRFPGAKEVIDAFGEDLAKRLDRTLSPAREQDLYEVAGALAPLGVIIELALAGFFQPAPQRVEKWRVGFTAIDKATKSERGFWWKYVRRVRAGFDLLAPSTQPTQPKAAPPARPVARRPATAKPSEPKPAAPAGPVERYHHPKLGNAVLVGRSGHGDDERLDLRFEDGQVRKILARFVTRIDEGH